jgi:hypothetical protein
MAGHFYRDSSASPGYATLRQVLPTTNQPSAISNIRLVSPDGLTISVVVAHSRAVGLTMAGEAPMNIGMGDRN